MKNCSFLIENKKNDEKLQFFDKIRQFLTKNWSFLVKYG